MARLLSSQLLLPLELGIKPFEFGCKIVLVRKVELNIGNSHVTGAFAVNNILRLSIEHFAHLPKRKL
jgi:hypothetical protein